MLGVLVVGGWGGKENRRSQKGSDGGKASDIWML